MPQTWVYRPPDGEPQLCSDATYAGAQGYVPWKGPIPVPKPEVPATKASAPTPPIAAVQEPVTTKPVAVATPVPQSAPPLPAPPTPPGPTPPPVARRARGRAVEGAPGEVKK